MKITRIKLVIIVVVSLVEHHLSSPIWNVAFNKSASQSGDVFGCDAQRSVDGIDGEDRSLGSCSYTNGLAGFKHQPWWQVDLEQEYYVKGVAISQSNYSPYTKHLTHNFTIDIYRDNQTKDDAIQCYYQEAQAKLVTTELYMCVNIIRGRYVRITVHSQPGISELVVLCEVRVFGSHESVSNFVRMEGTEIASTPFNTHNIKGYGECAMKCHVVPGCRIFSVKQISDIYECNIYTTMFLVANSTGNPNEAIFII